MADRLGTAANIGVIALCVCVCGDIAQRYLGRPCEPAELATRQVGGEGVGEYQRGDRLEGTVGIDVEGAGRTLLMVVRASCRYCRESVPFYRELARAPRGGGKGARLVAVCLEAADTCRRFLEDGDVRLDETVEARPGTLRIRGTPTLILVDRASTVLRVWTGRLSEEAQKEVLRELTTGS